MTDTNTEKKMRAEGWSIVEDDGFIAHVGPLWERSNGDTREYAIVAERKHKNRRGLVQGGLLMTLADRSLGIEARLGCGSNPVATIQMDTHFIDAAKLGEILISTPRVVRSTRTLIFMSTEIKAHGRSVAMANAVFKVMKS